MVLTIDHSHVSAALSSQWGVYCNKLVCVMLSNTTIYSLWGWIFRVPLTVGCGSFGIGKKKKNRAHTPHTRTLSLSQCMLCRDAHLFQCGWSNFHSGGVNHIISEATAAECTSALCAATDVWGLCSHPFFHTFHKSLGRCSVTCWMENKQQWQNYECRFSSWAPA